MLIRLVLLYDIKIWTIVVENQVGVFKRKVLRTIYGDEGGKLNYELHQMLGEPHIVHTEEIGHFVSISTR